MDLNHKSRSVAAIVVLALMLTLFAGCAILETASKIDTERFLFVGSSHGYDASHLGDYIIPIIGIPVQASVIGAEGSDFCLFLFEPEDMYYTIRVHHFFRDDYYPFGDEPDDEDYNSKNGYEEFYRVYDNAGYEQCISSEHHQVLYGYCSIEHQEDMQLIFKELGY